MPIFGTGPKRTDGKTNPEINATPTYLTPTQVSNLAVWFDAVDTSTIKTNISSLNQWWSKTNISTVMSNAYGLQGPSWISTTQNGLPVVRFYGNNSSFMLSLRVDYNSSIFATNNETTMFLAYNPTNVGAPFGVEDSSSHGAGGFRLHPQSGQTWFFGNNNNPPNNARLDYSYPVNTGFKVETYFGRASTLGFRNSGALFATSTMLTGLSFYNPSTLVFMGAQNYNSRAFTQDIGEALIYNRGLTDYEMSGIEAYLSRKWGIQNKLPYNHIGIARSAPLMGYKLLTYYPVVSNFGLWYDAMDTSTIKDTAGNFPPSLPPNALGVAQWNDKSGNNKNLINSSTYPSLFNLLGNNFYPTVYSIGYNQSGYYYNLRLSNATSLYTGSSISAFFVLSIQPNANNTPFFSLTSSYSAQYIPINPNGPNPSTFDFTLNYISNTIGFSRYGGSAITSNNVLTAPLLNYSSINLVSIFINPTQNTIGNVLPSTNLISINGAFVSSSTQYSGNPFNFQFISMFGGYNFPANNSYSYFNEVGIFFRTLTTPERVAYESQLINKWKLPSNAPVSYINAGPNISTPYLWVDAYSSSNVSTTVTTDGLTRVDTVFDRSGNGRNFNVISGNSNIFYNRVSTMNQFNSLYFSTGSYNGIISNTVPINAFSTNSYSFFMVYNQLSTQTVTRLFAANNQTGSDSALGGFSYQILGQTPYFTPTTAYQSAGANINNGTNYLTSFIVNGGPTFDIYQPSIFNVYTNSGSGAAFTSNINFASTNLLNISQFNIGGRINNLSYGFNGLISEVILYNRALSNAERQTIESYLINKWGISTLVSNVPVTSGLNLWLDAYDPSCVITDSNSNVLLWRDKSIYNYNFSNFTSNYPVYKNNPQNALPSISITSNATTQALVNSNFNISSISSFSVLGVVNLSNTTINGRIFSILSTSQQLDYQIDNGFVIYNNFGTGVGYSRSSFSITGTATSNTNNLFSLIVNNISTQNDVVVSTTALGINGVMKQFLTATANSTINVNLGYIGTSKNNDITMKYSGLISELLFYNRTLSFVERQQVESYLMSKWKI